MCVQNYPKKISNIYFENIYMIILKSLMLETSAYI
jgi:hypothetical protein